MDGWLVADAKSVSYGQNRQISPAPAMTSQPTQVSISLSYLCLLGDEVCLYV